MTKLVSSLALDSVLVSGLYAQGGKNCDFKKDRQSCNYKQKNEKQYNNHNRSGFLNMFSELNLSSEQKTKIENIMKDSRKNQEFPCDAFSKDSFDKAKFAKIMRDKQDKKFEEQADILDKAYKVLDSKQKEQLRTLMDLRKEKMKQRFED